MLFLAGADLLLRADAKGHLLFRVGDRGRLLRLPVTIEVDTD